MIWWVNILLGFLIGSFVASYVPAYRNGFMAILGRLASSKKNKPKTKGKK